MRVLYAAKINEGELKGDVESSMNIHFKQITDEPFNGIKVILGSWSIHLIEGEKQSVMKLLRSINTNIQSAQPFYNQAWVLHFSDEVLNWFSLSLFSAQTRSSISGIARPSLLVVLVEN
jgi:hypothetical protein